MLARPSLLLRVLVLVFLVALITGTAGRASWAPGDGIPAAVAILSLAAGSAGVGESPSHNNTQMWYAYDFGLSEGVPVRAARGGTVAFVQKEKNLCGGFEFRNDANYVTIYHPDGAATLYLHLRDVYVSVGQSISRGQTIGTAGRTGWTYCNPHLHFQRRSQGAWITDSKAVYFDEYPGRQLQRYGWYPISELLAWGSLSGPGRCGMGVLRGTQHSGGAKGVPTHGRPSGAGGGSGDGAGGGSSERMWAAAPGQSEGGFRGLRRCRWGRISL